jgi:type V secretory pathway adhesin AidA
MWQPSQKQEMQRRNEITFTILDALKTPHRPVKGKTTTFASTTIAQNAAYIPIVEILAASEGLIREYKRLDKTITDRHDEDTEPVAEIWYQGIQETERQLKMGARVALRNVKKVLGADVERVMTKDGEEEMHESERAGQELSYELQKSLRYVERGVKRMVKGLPNDEPQ